MVFLCTPGIAIAQSFNIEWQGCFGGSKWEYPSDLIAVADGYLIVGGTGSSDGDITHNNGGGDGWLFKISNSGELLWDKTYGGLGDETLNRILPAGQGYYYLIGVAAPRNGDLWILKIDSTGNVLWEGIFGGSSVEQMPTGVVSSDGGLVALILSASNDGDITKHYGLWDAWMIKVNSEGEKQWDFTLGSPGQEFGQAIIQTSDGGFLVGIASAPFKGGNLTCTPHNIDKSDAVVVKLDSNLNIEWDRCYGGSMNDNVTGLLELSDGYLVGANAHSNDGDVSGNHGNADHWIVKINFDGNILWQKCLGGTGSEGYTQIYNADDNFIVTGTTSSYNGDVTGNNSISEDYRDIWIVNIDSDGDLLWQQCFGGIANEQMEFGFHYISENNFVIAGQTDNGPSFDVGCTPHGGNGDRDFWVFEVNDTTVSVQEHIAAQATLTAYPNPAKDYVCFEILASKHDVAGLQIFSGTGKQIVSPLLYLSARKIIWDTRQVPPGIYFYSFVGNGVSNTGKVVISR